MRETGPFLLYTSLFILLLLSLSIPSGFSEVAGIIPGISYYGAEYSSDNIPPSLTPGQEIQCMIEFRNTGMTAWEYNVEKFGVEYSGDTGFIKIDPLISILQKGARVHSGQSYQFPFLIKVIKPGHTTLRFAVVRIFPSGETTPVSELKTIPVEITEGAIVTQDSGSIQVSGGPFHFPVTLNGNQVGVTPITIPGVSAGYHTVSIEGNEGVMEKTVEVRPNEVIEVTYSPEKSLIITETKKSLFFNNSSPFITIILSNFFIILGLVLTLTAVGICAVVIMTGKMKRVKFLVSQINSSSRFKCLNTDVNISTRRNLKKEEVKFDPIAGLFHQGEKKHVKIKVINNGLKNIVIDDLHVAPGDCQILYREINDDNPGDKITDVDFTYIDGNGKEKNKIVHIHYRIHPNVPDLSWIFDRFYQKKGKIVAVLKIKNKNLFDFIAESTVISAGDEKNIELIMEEPDSNESSVFRKISISFLEGTSLILPVRIPYNNGVSLYFSRQFKDSLEWFKKKIEDGDTDPILYRYLNLIKKQTSEDRKVKVQKSSISNDKENIAPLSDKKPEIKVEDGDILEKFSDFPESLNTLYRPVSLISTDRMGTIYRAIRSSDSESIALRILNPCNIPLSSIELQIQAWRSLKHQNILQIRYWERDPVYFMEFDLPSGAVQKKRRVYTLADLQVPIPPSSALRIIKGLAQGIAYTHRQGVRHYLLEPSAILLDRGLNPKISGFDTSVLVQSQIPEKCWVIAPEQSDPDNYGNPGKKTDIYQIGAVLYYLITGSIPSDTDPLARLPSKFKKGYSKFDTVIYNCMSPDKNQRYGEIDDLIRELDILYTHFSQTKTEVSYGGA